MFCLDGPRRRLNKNAALRRKLVADQSEDGVPVEGDQIEWLFALIARGLAWYHWQVCLDAGKHLVRAVILTSLGAKMFDGVLFKMTGHDRNRINVGNGTFHYQGKRGVDDAALTLWRFRIDEWPLVTRRNTWMPLVQRFGIFAVTGPRAIVEDMNHKLFLP